MIEGHETCQNCKSLITCLAFDNEIVVAVCARCLQTARIVAPTKAAGIYPNNRLVIAELLRSQKTTQQNLAGLARGTCPRARTVTLEYFEGCPTCKKRAFFSKSAPKSPYSRQRAMQRNKKSCPQPKHKVLPLP